MNPIRNYTENSIEKALLRVSVFQDTDPDELQKHINFFLDDHDRMTIYEILQTQNVITAEDGDSVVVVTVTILYTQHDEYKPRNA